MHIILNISRRNVLGVMAAACAVFFTPAGGVQAAFDLDGKTIDWVIPFSEGGGSAKWANFYAPLLSDALPGKPKVVVKFMPGAGSTKGANWFHDQAKPDGLTILGTSGSTQFPYLLGDPRVKYEYKDWHVVLASGTGGVAYLPSDLGAKFKKDPNSILGVDFIYGSQGATRLDLVPLLAWELLGLKVEPVFGIKGRGDGRLMFERGEANIDYQTSSGYLKGVVPLVKDGKAVPMMTWGALNARGGIVRDPTFPDIPTFKEVYKRMKGEDPSGAAWEAWKAFFVAGFPAQKMVFLPKGATREMIRTYSRAFKKVIKRPDFAEISAKRLGKYPQMTDRDAKKAFQQATTVNSEAKTFVKNWLKDRYGVVLK